MRRLAWLAAPLVLAAALWATWGSGFLAQDRCLDAGGAWGDGACVGARPAP